MAAAAGALEKLPAPSGGREAGARSRWGHGGSPAFVGEGRRKALRDSPSTVWVKLTFFFFFYIYDCWAQNVSYRNLTTFFGVCVLQSLLVIFDDDDTEDLHFCGPHVPLAHLQVTG